MKGPRDPKATEKTTGISANSILRTESTPGSTHFVVPLQVVFYICSFSHLLAASNAPIQDCDETFNYWEPLHYLLHGYGLQTWEYSPEYSIRSWAYILIHAIPTKIVSFFGVSKTFEFYALRCILAMTGAATETQLYSALCRALHPRVGAVYVIVVASTPGLFYASSAFLPSSFTMYTGTLGLAAFLDPRGGSKFATAIMWFGLGTLLGWPFAGALIIPFVAEEAFSKLFGGGDLWKTCKHYLDGIVRCLMILGLQVIIDAVFFRNLVVVPWRIVIYNVFSGEDRGPNIFGTEPWHFYVRNLLLNFNVWFILAMAAGPLLILLAIVRSPSTTKQPLIKTTILTTPFYLWFAIFTLQPHKEERFMFPSYPFLALNASIATHTLVSWIMTTSPQSLISKIPTKFKFVVLATIPVASTTLSALRIIGTITAYQAPLKIYTDLSVSKSDLTSVNSTLCLGKDWYRFPSSFFLPSPMHAKFIKSAFDGLLPGEFLETESEDVALYPGTWKLPSGMNDRNQEDMGKYTDIRDCSFLVDSSFPSLVPSDIEPDYRADKGRWEAVECQKFLDGAVTGVVGRLIWVPEGLGGLGKMGRVWGEHCLLKARKAHEGPEE